MSKYSKRYPLKEKGVAGATLTQIMLSLIFALTMLHSSLILKVSAKKLLWNLLQSHITKVV